MTDLEKKFDFEYTKKEDSYRYMLLSRMREDCNYFLRNGNGHEGSLWAGNVIDHIAVMKEIWNSFNSEQKPEWLSLEDISNYETRMTIFKDVREKLEEFKISNFEYDGEGYLHFTTEADNYMLEGLFRIHDLQNGESLKLVSIDYGYLHPEIAEKWNDIENTIGAYAQIRYPELLNSVLEEQQKNTTNLSLEERYTKAMELAGYERTEVDDIFGVYTVAFKNKDTEELIQTDGWQMLGDELETLKPISEADMETFEQLVHPEGRISFYCKNLGGTGLDEDNVSISYPDLDSALNAYLSVQTDGRILGYKIGDTERVISYFDTVTMQHQFVKKDAGISFYEQLTINEKNIVRDALERIASILNKDNAYQAIYEGISTVAHKCAAEISAGKTEWGSWIGRIANTHRPQDYVDVDIIGYVTVHEVHCNINVIHANEILSGKSVIIKTDPERMEESIRHGIADAIKQLDSYMHEAVEILDSDNEYPMCLYSPYTFHALPEHYIALEDAGYTTFPVMKKDFKEMTKDDIKNYIQHFYKQYDAELICTSRVLDSLATTVVKMIDSGQIVDAQTEVNELLVKDTVISFIKERIPLVDKVSGEVQESITTYFSEHLTNFTPMEICRTSNHPEDNNLYAVIAKQTNGEYACWTSWHQAKETMNYGHYGLPDREMAFSIIKDNFNDISDEMRKYDPEKSLVTLNALNNVEKQDSGKSVVLPFVNRSRGR